MARQFEAVVIGASTGGVHALRSVLGRLPADFPLPVLVAQHISPDAGDGMSRLLDDLCAIRVKEADELDRLAAATVYLAPPNYHLLVEKGGHLALSADPPVSYARPSVDVLFESAANVFGSRLIGVVLTGANHDGAAGARTIGQRGGAVIVQNPEQAEARQMPEAALAATKAHHVVDLEGIADILVKLSRQTRRRENSGA